MKIKIAGIFLALILSSPSIVQASPFDQGVVTGSILIGSGRAYNDDYTVFGVGIGYYLVNGLQIGVDYEYWSGGDPTIQQISPRLNYVFARSEIFSPYVGAFYRRTKISNLPDDNAYGGRAGAYMRSGNNLIVGFGIAYVEYEDCQEAIYSSCSDTYPEFTFGAYF